MARVRGIVARLVIRGTDAQVAAARRETQARLDANAANLERVVGEDGERAYVFDKKKARGADGHDANGKRERPRIKPEFDWRHSGSGWDNGGLVGSEGALGSHCTWR